MNRGISGVVLMVLAAFSGGGGCSRLSGGCTTVGCSDQVSLRLQLENGGAPGLAVSLDIDGRTVDCAAPVGTGDSGCGSDVRISSRELVTCTEEIRGEARIQKCTGTGKFEEVISISGTPAAIHAIARNADAAIVAERTFQPRYTDVQPNGPDCEPTCRQWSDVWMLPASP